MIKEKIKRLILFFGNPHLLLCLALAWIVTNGWSYIMLALGTLFGIEWMVAVAGAYITFLWLPISPEKLFTVAIAMGLLRLLFPEDEKTLQVLRLLREKFRMRRKKKKEEKEGAIPRERALVVWKKLEG